MPPPKTAYIDAADLPPSDDDEEDDEKDVLYGSPPLSSSSSSAAVGLEFEIFSESNERDRLTYKKCWVIEEGLGGGATIGFAYSFCGAREIVCRMGVPAGSTAAAFADVGLVVLCWVWLACPCRSVVCEVGVRAAEEAFWELFYREAFAEWALVNGLDEDAITVRVEMRGPARSRSPRASTARAKRVLCGLGGGKDSIVARFLALDQPAVASCDWLYVADGFQEFEGSTRLRALSPSVVVRHDFDYETLDRRRTSRRRPTGHPWAALVAFDAAAVAEVLGYDAVVVGNERSSNFGNGRFVGDVEVNHQFDKSLVWERRFDAIFGCDYFSPLQPLWETQIAAVFATERRLASYWTIFRSCNDSGDPDTWCARCAKCCFVFCLLAAWRPDAPAVFDGVDLFDQPPLLPVFRALAGLDGTNNKPLDCVGTPDETRLSLWLARRHYARGLPLALALLVDDDALPTPAQLDILDPPLSPDHHHNLPSWWDSTLDPPKSLIDLKALAAHLRRQQQQQQQQQSAAA